jgi:hypothetical protein
MIRHLRWLTRPTGRVAPGAIALSVYAESDRDGHLRHRPACESGFEGVACVDDVARAAILHCTIWRTRHLDWAMQSARGFLAFVCGMQDGEGRFANFIQDWNGRRNTSGPTSYVGGPWWTARALHALAIGYATFHSPAYAMAFRRGLPWLRMQRIGTGAAALGALATISFWRATADSASAAAAEALVDGVCRARQGNALLDDSDTDPGHLWGRYQEQALTVAASAAGRPELVRIAQDSADAVLVPAAEALATRAPTLPYEASRLALSLAAIADATGKDRYGDLARRSRAWFGGLNPAGAAVYDRLAGRAYDGVDFKDGRAVRSRNSGAEANIEAALALLDSLPFERFEPKTMP